MPTGPSFIDLGRGLARKLSSIKVWIPLAGFEVITEGDSVTLQGDSSTRMRPHEGSW
jgi:hypothetical protein